MSELAEKICVINSAGSDIGLECAFSLARMGATIFLVNKENNELQKKIEQAQKENHKISLLTLENYNDKEVTKVFDQIKKQAGPAGILVNSYFNYDEKQFQALSLEQWHKILEENLTPYYLFSRAIIPHMKELGEGVIINISSILALRGIPGRAGYSAARGGVQSLTRALAVELAPLEIRVNNIIPGYIKTEQYKKFRLNKDPGYEKKLLRHIPMGRLGKPGEVSRVVSFLAGPESSYITGASIPVDGGYCIA
ncbi:MAG: SDR family NAD(P)-dependent oxidoreductase [Vulcanimicrobiota bacterium]